MSVRRRLAVIGIALGVIATAGVLYLKPEALNRTGPLIQTSVRATSGYSVTYDFVTGSRGWALLVDYKVYPEKFFIFATTDGAEHWRKQFSGQAFQGGPYLRFIDDRDGLLDFGGNAYLSADGGDHWQPLTVPGGAALISVTGHDEVWAAAFVDGYQHLLRTTNGGQTWTGITKDPPLSTFVMPIEADQWPVFRRDGEGWLGSSERPDPVVFRTTDGGESWDTVGLTGAYFFISSGISYYTTVRIVDSTTLVAFVRDGSGAMSGTLISTDDGSTWQSVSFPRDAIPEDVTFVGDGHAWFVNGRSVYLTDDDGRSWTEVPQPDFPEEWSMDRAWGIDGRHAYWVLLSSADSSVSALAMTSDGGLHWRLVNSPQP